jgi:hypothetical protein
VSDDESVTYERRDQLPPQRSSDLEPISVTAAVHELVDRPEAGATPIASSLTNGVGYEQVPRVRPDARSRCVPTGGGSRLRCHARR